MVGPLLRNGGGLFIRRVFGSDELYKSVFYEYLALLLQSGHNLEVFIEGTRCLLSSSLVRKADGSVIRAGDVRSGMQLAGEFGAVTVTSAESESRPKAATTEFYRVNLRDGSSYTVTSLHKVTLRSTVMPRLHFSPAKGASMPRVCFVLFDRRTLTLRKWGQRSVRISEDKDDPLYSADASKDWHTEDAGSASRVRPRRPTLVAATRAAATAAMWHLLEQAVARRPHSLAARHLTTGDTIDVEVEKLYASNFGPLNDERGDDESAQEEEEKEEDEDEDDADDSATDSEDSAAQDEGDDENSAEEEKCKAAAAAATSDGPTFAVVGSTSVAKKPPPAGRLVAQTSWRRCLSHVRMPESPALVAPAAHVVGDKHAHALAIRSIEKLRYDQPQEFARIEVDGNHRYQLADRTLTHNSRSGKVKRPKIGVLSVLIDLLASGRLGDKDLMLVPIAISYDKVIEGSSYVNEMLGAKVSRTHITEACARRHVRIGDNLRSKCSSILRSVG